MQFICSGYYDRHSAKPRWSLRDFNRIGKKVIVACKTKVNADCSIAIVTPTEIKRINKIYRKIDKPTDVLSFNLGANGEREQWEIMLCPVEIKKRAVKFGRTQKTHEMMLFIHGVLHCLGFDHETPTQIAQMEKMEDELQKRLMI